MPKATALVHHITRRTRLAQKHEGMKTRERILTYLQTRVDAGTPIPPSFREIMDACQVSSTSVVHYHLEKLAGTGQIVWGRGIARGMFVPQPQVQVAQIGEELEKTREELLLYFTRVNDDNTYKHWYRRAVTADEIPLLARAVVNHAIRGRRGDGT